jgi:hypothetical protein
LKKWESEPPISKHRKTPLFTSKDLPHDIVLNPPLFLSLSLSETIRNKKKKVEIGPPQLRTMTRATCQRWRSEFMRGFGTSLEAV